jgi:hypothetical protein
VSSTSFYFEDTLYYFSLELDISLFDDIKVFLLVLVVDS